MRTHAASNQHARRLLLLGALFALTWAAAVAAGGGLVFQTPWGPLSSRHPGRPLAVGVTAVFAYVLLYRRHWASDLALVRSVGPRGACAASMVATFLGSVWWSSFFAAGPDASGYVSQAAMWLRGELTWTAPEWVNAAGWPDAAATSAPVGYRPAPATQTIVPTYPPGLPLLMAAFHRAGGPDAVYLVVPACGALAVWATYRIARRFAGDGAGAVACALLLSSPAFLIMLTQPMSDVPAAALWSSAIVAALRGSAAGAGAEGLIAAGAILIRPNLAPLALPIAALIALESGSAGSGAVRLLAFGVTVLPAVVTLGVLNAMLHGGALQSGYGSVANLYDVDRVLPNLASYTSALVSTQTPVVLFGLALPLFLPKRTLTRREAIVLLVAYPLAVLALYLPYERMTVWWFLRFLLPAYPALVGGSAAALVLLTVPHRTIVRRWAVSALLIAITAHGFVRAHREGVFGIRDAEQRYVAAVQYAETLPARSVLMSLLHSGTLHHYTRRDVLRWDALEPPYLDRAVSYLRDRGYAVYLFLDDTETEAFKTRFSDALVLRQVQPEFAVHLPGGVLVYSLDTSTSGKSVHDRAAPADDLGQPRVVQPVGRIGGRVIVRIAERRRVGEHDRAEPLLPERPVVRPAHAGNPCRGR